ncbi:hypothetical protein CKK33_17395 [Mucilaginibacter sp. MD40]|uniref:hypothetical protein n=1 Tax=Mucilaginibacter sp. MD40 TaxID=2029590 RepID=UPI000BACB2A0|nr:hypothetical protein [Mucilaginibacter sp. MD40]PAW95177.1 hypothetical protein CKK33_17395 [Mucilaginibacter sp. MD40]
MKSQLFYAIPALLLISIGSVKGQVKVKIESGQIFVNDPWKRPDERKLQPFADSLDRNLNVHPNDTTSLFYRALLYLQFNKFIVNPDLSTNRATNKLLLAMAMAGRADSLRMQNFNLKVLRAQIAKELTNRYAPMDLWRFTEKQIAERKKKFEYFKGLANAYYDKLALIDKDNAYDYQRLKVK